MDEVENENDEKAEESEREEEVELIEEGEENIIDDSSVGGSENDFIGVKEKNLNDLEEKKNRLLFDD